MMLTGQTAASSIPIDSGAFGGVSGDGVGPNPKRIAPGSPVATRVMVIHQGKRRI